MKPLSQNAKKVARENGWTHYLRSRKGYLALPASSMEEAQEMLLDGSVDPEEDCEIVPVD